MESPCDPLVRVAGLRATRTEGAEEAADSGPWHPEALGLADAPAGPDGAGVRIGLVGAAVPAQLHESVPGLERGVDLVDGGRGAARLGATLVALLLGASGQAVAPGTTVVPVRVARKDLAVDPATLARGIRAALEQRCDVIVTTVGTLPGGGLGPAVRAATDAGVVVLSAAGDDLDFTCWPARVPMAIGVGAMGPNGEPWGRSDADLVRAPGHRLVADPEVPASSTAYAAVLAGGLVARWLAWHGPSKLRARYPGPRLAAAAAAVLRAAQSPALRDLLAAPLPDPADLRGELLGPAGWLEDAARSLGPQLTAADLAGLGGDLASSVRQGQQHRWAELGYHLLVDARFREAARSAISFDRGAPGAQETAGPTAAVPLPAMASEVLRARVKMALWASEQRAPPEPTPAPATEPALPNSVLAASLAVVSVRGKDGRSVRRGEGFLAGHGVFLAAYHLLPDAHTAGSATARFLQPERGLPVVVGFDPDLLHVAQPSENFAVVATRSLSTKGGTLSAVRPARLAGALDHLSEGTPVRLAGVHSRGSGMLVISAAVRQLGDTHLIVTWKSRLAPQGRLLLVADRDAVVGLVEQVERTDDDAPQDSAVQTWRCTARRADLVRAAVADRLRDERLQGYAAALGLAPAPEVPVLRDIDEEGVDSVLTGYLRGDPSATATGPITVLVHLREPGWKPPPGTDPDDLQILSTGRSVVPARVSPAGLAMLARSEAVLWVEGSRTGVELFRSDDRAPTERWWSGAREVGAEEVHRRGERGERAIVAIIDNGIDPLHATFRDPADPTASRILGYWDQGGAAPPSPREALGFGPTFGTYHSKERIETYLAARQTPAGLSRDAVHGTHVASLAAGGALAGAPGATFPGGVAPRAKLLVIRSRMHAASGELATLGYSATHVLALDFIKEFSMSVDLPVVVNLSQGMNAGAHDGTSLLEQAFDDFSGGGREPGLVIVKSAGNERATPP